MSATVSPQQAVCSGAYRGLSSRPGTSISMQGSAHHHPSLLARRRGNIQETSKAPGEVPPQMSPYDHGRDKHRGGASGWSVRVSEPRFPTEDVRMLKPVFSSDLLRGSCDHGAFLKYFIRQFDFYGNCVRLTCRTVSCTHEGRC